MAASERIVLHNTVSIGNHGSALAAVHRTIRLMRLGQVVRRQRPFFYCKLRATVENALFAFHRSSGSCR